MNAVVQFRPNAATNYTGAQMALIHRTVAKDTNRDEFDLFMEVARMKGLDPFSKQIAAIVFSKTNADKRNMSIITTIDGMRAIAARSGRYRPDEDEPTFVYDADVKDPDTNPLGLVSAKVRIWIADALHAGGWKPVTGIAYWDEFAPVKDEWEWGEKKGDRKKTGKQVLDGNWPKMGRIMLAKCAEAQAIRKAFPEDLSGLYEGTELDRARVVEVTASEIIGAHEADVRLARVGSANTIMMQMTATSPLEPIPLGQITDRVIGASAEWDLTQVRWFLSANTHPLREFWARAQADALGLKKHLEGLQARLIEEEEASEEADA